MFEVEFVEQVTGGGGATRGGRRRDGTTQSGGGRGNVPVAPAEPTETGVPSSRRGADVMATIDH